ncbi:MAG: branched-chain amino acid transport system substrate-binding protein [Acidimicrobiaceae bacterium]
MVRVRSAVAVLLAAALLTAACSSDKKTASTGGSASSSANAPLTASFRGVTATTIKIGVLVVDFKCIEQFVDFTQGDAQKIVQALVDDVNKNGGILGRKLEIVFKNLCPLQPTDVAAACTSLTDDDQVFAAIGVYDTPPSDGSNQLCLTRDKDTILINELTTKKVMDQAKAGLLLTPNILPERRLDALLSLLKQKKTLNGKKVAVLADQDTASFETAVNAAASGLGATTGSTAVLTITNEDTSAAQAQLDTFIEKWKTEGTNALVMGGLLVSAKQFVEKIRKAIPSMLLITTDSSVGDQAKDEKKAGVTPNPYDGMLSLSGLGDSETFKSEGVQRCVKIYEAATGETVLGPDDLKPDANGKRIEVYIGIQDRCNELAMLIAVATKAGANLTNDTWIAAVNSLGKFKTATATIASLKEGKYDAEDGFRLGAWDSTIQPDGDFKPDSPELLDVSS